MHTPPKNSSTDVSACQLELFPSGAASTERPKLSAELARAQLSPGWWRTVAPLFTFAVSQEITVCREVDGELLVETTAGDDESFTCLVDHVRASVRHICGCCGSPSAVTYRATFDGPTRRVCTRCRDRLCAGEEFLKVAGDFFHLDGSRRLKPLVSPNGGLSKTPAGVPEPPPTGLRPCVALPPEELRQLVAEIRAGISRDIVAQEEAVADIALLAACHVGAGLSHGARALLIGPSGSGKSQLVRAMFRQLEAFDLPPMVHVQVNELSAPGWHGTSIGDLISNAIGRDAVDSPRAQRLVICLDELHHIARDPLSTGNSRQKQNELLASCMSVGHGTTLLGDGRLWSSERALVLSVGAFTGMLALKHRPTIADLADAGIPIELSTRLAPQMILLKRLPEPDLIALLRRWPALLSLVTLCERLGYKVHIPHESFARAARVVTLGHDESTARTAGGWLVAALRRCLNDALAMGERAEIVVAPDSLPIPPTATRPPRRDEPPEPFGPWDTTIILTPR